MRDNPATAQRSTVVTLLPVIIGVFVAYVVIGLALPVIPLHVHGDLGLDTFEVGLVAGAQFTASLLSRFWSGSYADRKGGKQSLIVGLIIAVIAGCIYLLSLQFTNNPALSVSILIIGRAVLGAAESFIVSGGLVWGLSLIGTQNTGKVMSWVGTAMYVAFALGAPLGTALYSKFGFTSIALATVLIPLVTLLLISPYRSIVPAPSKHPSFMQVIGQVWLPGLGLALSSVGFGSITTFIVLLFSQHGWEQAWLSLTAVSTTFVLGRLFFGYLPDKMGGAKIALICILIEAAGQLMIWLAPVPAMVLAGAMLTGLGYSLIYPGFGVEAVRRTSPESRGLASGAYTAFLDLALGVANPALGAVASAAGINAVYLVSALIVSCAIIIAVWLLRHSTTAQVQNTAML